MACRSKVYRLSGNVWSDGTTTPVYHSMLRLARADWAKARVSLITEGSSGAEICTSAAAYGDEESDFNAPAVVDFPATPTTAANNTTAWGASYAAFDVTKQQVDLGVRCKNSGAGTKMEHVRVTLIVDLSEEP
jgi:hypothetical protein